MSTYTNHRDRYTGLILVAIGLILLIVGLAGFILGVTS